MAKYQLTHTDIVLEPPRISFSTKATDNRHSRAYHAWLAAGNTPDPADPLPPVVRLPVVTKPGPSDNSIAAIRTKLGEVIQVLQDAGLMRES